MFTNTAIKASEIISFKLVEMNIDIASRVVCEFIMSWGETCLSVSGVKSIGLK